MLFTVSDVKDGYADYCRAKQNFEMLYETLEKDGLLINEKNEYGYRKIREDAPTEAKKEYEECLMLVMEGIRSRPGY